MGKVRRKYDKEFKKEAVLLVIEKGRPISEVARDFAMVGRKTPSEGDCSDSSCLGTGEN